MNQAIGYHEELEMNYARSAWNYILRVTLNLFSSFGIAYENTYEKFS